MAAHHIDGEGLEAVGGAVEGSGDRRDGRAVRCGSREPQRPDQLGADAAPIVSPSASPISVPRTRDVVRARSVFSWSSFASVKAAYPSLGFRQVAGDPTPSARLSVTGRAQVVFEVGKKRV
ncbi:hypothetical protein [Streptomyces sp. NPDC001070]